MLLLFLCLNTNLIHRVTVGKLRDVLQHCSSWQFIANLTHDEVGEIFHSLRCTSHADELEINVNIIYLVYSMPYQQKKLDKSSSQKINKHVLSNNLIFLIIKNT